jgi:hypothetical protein
LSEEAWNLLVLRLRYRALALRVFLGGAIGTMVVVVVLVAVTPRLVTDAELGLVISGSVAVGLALAEFCIVRGDRAIGRTLVRRVSRGSAYSLREFLGRSGIRWTIVVAVAQIAVAIALPIAHAGELDWVFPLGVVGLWAISAGAAAHILRRPAVAVDGSSLALDERLRYTEALQSLLPLATAFMIVRPTHSWLDFVPSVGNFLMLCLVFLAILGRPPWARSSTDIQAPAGGVTV